jgi:hypothetical protein
MAMFAIPPEALLRAFQKILFLKLRAVVTTLLLKANVFEKEATPVPPMYTLL